MFGDRMRKRREELGISQDQLAVRLGVTQQTISHWETEERKRFGTDMLNQLATALKCSIDYLLGRSPIPESDISQLTPHLQHLIVQLRGLSREPTTEDVLGAWLSDNISQETQLRQRRKTHKNSAFQG